MMDWRQDDGLKKATFYKKKFAWLPIKISGEFIWLKSYYTKYARWTSEVIGDDSEHGHVDNVENITQETYVVRRLSENL